MRERRLVEYALFLVVLFACTINLAQVQFAHAYSISFSGSQSIEIDINGGNEVNTSIVSDDIEIVSNCRAGYNLLLTSSVNDNNLYLDGDNTNNTSGTFFGPSDGTTALSSATNTWGYNLPASGVPTASSVFLPVPISGASAAILKTPAQTASATDIDDEFSVYYGAAAAGLLPAGSYKMKQDSHSNYGALVYFLTMDPSCAGYTVEYDANGGTGTMNDQDILSGSATNLTANGFTAPSIGSSYTDSGNHSITGQAGKLWTFWGWNTEIDGSGDWYKDKESVTDIAASGDTLTLYAQWKQPTLSDLVVGTQVGSEKVIDHNLMQDMSSAACYNSDITTKAALEAANKTGAVTLTDNRGGVAKTYDVSKLADGLCWMTTNLALGGNSPIVLTSEDTDLADGTTFTLPAGDTTASSTATEARIRLSNSSGLVRGGYYYSWAAAVANTASISGSGVPTTSVCPKNWDLPTNDHFSRLISVSNYSSSKPPTNLPDQFTVNNGFTNGSTFYGTSYGFYWSSSSSSVSAAYGVRVTSTSMTNSAASDTTYGGNKYYRKNIRCIANLGNANITYYSNNNSASTQSQTVDISIGKIASGSLFTAESHKQFKEWNTRADGTGTTYNANERLTTLNIYEGQSLELYAIWNNIWTLSFVNTDGGTVRTKTVIQGQSSTVAPTNPFTRANCVFAGWDTNSAGTTVVYTDGQSITPTSDMTFYTVWKPVYKIVYNGNGVGTAGTTSDPIMSVSHDNLTGGESITLYASNYIKSGYGFAGWSFEKLNPDDSNYASELASATIYGPNETITAPDYTGAPSSTASMKLYAVWIPASADNLQGWNKCSDLPSGRVIGLTDTRDNNVYAVAKLADGKCWMIENLRLADQTLTISNTHNPVVGKGNIVTLVNVDSTGTTITSPATANHLSVSVNPTAYAWCNENTDSCINKSMLFDGNTTDPITDMTSGDAKVYSYGNYYNWYSATAGRGTRSNSTNNSSVAGDICPYGWILPKGGSKANQTNSDFWNLSVAVVGAAPADTSTATHPHYTGSEEGTNASNAMRSYPNNFVYSGNVNTASITGRTETGYYWSSTANTNENAYNLNLGSTSLYPGVSRLVKEYGRSVRCVSNL